MKPVAAFFAFSLGLLAGGAPALAMPESCQGDLNKYAQARLDAVQRINKLGKRPTPTAACNAFNTLVSAEARMIKWMEDNKEWCQIPDPLVGDLKKSSEQGKKIRGQACAAQKKEAQMRAQAAREAAGGGGAPRPAVRLPQGAL